ncbi:hydroxymethylglutaryl-CoA lyase [Spirosomataceae bacterium TFI 002]|nr:hydroxymethylglutaryl-CoA lyase [Spirosomataceae bacterium TFI 002]
MLKVKITDCPRDAIQGLKGHISVNEKAKYIQLALDSGMFHSVDFGSFVSHKAVPQMADTAEVLAQLKVPDNETKLLAIIANERGASEAATFPIVDVLGFPFSISEEFQKRNAGTGREEALEKVERIYKIANDNNKVLRVYISMAFGNPYDESWNTEIVTYWVEKLIKIGITEIALSDTVGVAKGKDIESLFETLIKQFPVVTFSAHFHALPGRWKEKVSVAYDAGCRHFDGAMNGFGGCPMADDDLVGNIPTEGLLAWKGEEQNRINELVLAFQELIKHG